jgi:divalent metal cation (Fe/Co/Zn/Cd) transporter
MLAWGGIGWHVVEFAIALAAGLAAGSIALIGFGADSLIESLAGGVVLWLFTGNRRGSSAAERRAQQLVAVSFVVLAAYVGVKALRTLVSGDHPNASWVGIGLAAFTAPTMPLLAYAKRRVGNQLHSAATVKEAAQTQLCAYLSIALLLGLGANALAGWWWADPLTALVIAAVAAKEGARAGAAKAVAMLADGTNRLLLRHAPLVSLDGGAPRAELLRLAARVFELRAGVGVDELAGLDPLEAVTL